MRKSLATLFFALLGAGSAGCSLIYNGVNTLFVEPAEFCTTLDHVQLANRCCRLAEEYWARTQVNNPTVAFSADYGEGFKEGFAFYLQYGACRRLARSRRRPGI